MKDDVTVILLLGISFMPHCYTIRAIPCEHCTLTYTFGNTILTSCGFESLLHQPPTSHKGIWSLSAFITPPSPLLPTPFPHSIQPFDFWPTHFTSKGLGKYLLVDCSNRPFFFNPLSLSSLTSVSYFRLIPSSFTLYPELFCNSLPIIRFHHRETRTNAKASRLWKVVWRPTFNVVQFVMLLWRDFIIYCMKSAKDMLENPPSCFTIVRQR